MFDLNIFSISQIFDSFQQFYNFKKQRNMYTGFKANTSISKTIVGGLGQTQLQTLQRQVDNYTRKLQQQKKKFFTIQDSHKVVSEQYQKQKGKLDQLKKQNSKSQNVIVQAKIKNLQANLEKAVSTYDQTLTHNQKLKNQIDMLRRQKHNFIQSKAILQQNIKNHQKEIQKKMNEIQIKKSTSQGLKNNIIQIKQKNQQQRQHYIGQFDKLQKDYLKQKRQREIYKFQKDSKPEPIDTQPLLKHRLKNLIKSNKNKIKMIQQYKKHMKQIEQAFNQIKKSSGLQDLNQITSNFIKSEQQNYSLYNYMDSLSRNIDNLQKANAEIQQSIIEQQQADNQRKKSIQQMPQQQRRKKQLEQYIKKKQQANQSLIKLIQAIKPNLSKTLIELANSRLNDDPTKIGQYQLGININDRTIQSYLADLQKFINNLLILKQQAKPKIVNSMKDNVTIYSKPVPNTDDLNGKQKAADPKDFKDEQKFLEQGKFRQYAMQYWDKKKHKITNSNVKD